MPAKRISPVYLTKEEPNSSLTYSSFSSDTAAWQAFRQGNESAFIFIYEKYFELLYAYGFSIVADPNLVKDVLQDLFIELRERRRHLGQTDAVKFYLFKCIKNRLLRELAKWPGKRESLETLPLGFHFTLSYEAQLIDRQLSEEKITKLNVAVAGLSPRQREIIYYSFYEGFTYRQIQEMMGLESQQTTRNLMYKAIQCLRKCI
ncbi:RNA polymerase sigma factor [Cyclobacterium qasimii]|uniref:RNA polymerase ECF-type sigma factor n=2 Tax=Cyclobacterium qasimii TaxID=1350429 RepID=S7VBT8_9BACT|nr:sigma-70 family RNA polymerase sigma factor [Cyclobacterium qasimii]EPR67037.1 RNA polymerase ECF-type sigma factor [Cyclobacterium qasimii M12-11B]GEO19744.1 DNA-directed RNA polymerase sigma-70 factor [Cyclobacterium qasimii]